MSDFIGAGLYCISSYVDPKMNVDLCNGERKDGTTVQI
jgi:hypothetical protein